MSLSHDILREIICRDSKLYYKLKQVSKKLNIIYIDPSVYCIIFKDFIRKTHRLPNEDLHGIQIGFYPNGTFRVEQNYKYGKKDGVQRSWYFNGQMESEEYWHLGIPDKTHKKWYENEVSDEDSKLHIEENYKDGVLDTRIIYDKNNIARIQKI